MRASCVCVCVCVYALHACARVCVCCARMTCVLIRYVEDQRLHELGRLHGRQVMSETLGRARLEWEERAWEADQRAAIVEGVRRVSCSRGTARVQPREYSRIFTGGFFVASLKRPALPEGTRGSREYEAGAPPS